MESFNAASREWQDRNLDDVMPDAECWEYINQEDDYGDSLRGEWWCSIDLMVFGGSFGNDHSPGSTHNTWVEVYGDDERAAFNERVAELEALPEYLESDDDDDDETA